MIEAWLASKAFKISKPLVASLAIAALFALGGVGFWRGMSAIERSIDQAAQSAREERNAHWRAEIEKSNAEVERQRAANAADALKRESEAGAEIARLSKRYQELERANAALPKSSRGGIGRTRIRLLNAAR